MLTAKLTRHPFGRKSYRGRSQGRLSGAKSLRVGALENRRLLAVDFAGGQNLLVPTDVNNDGFVTAVDALLIANDLYHNGSHTVAAAPNLVSAQSLAALDTTEASESDSSSRVYPDVNGDNYITPADVLLVAQSLRFGELQSETVVFTLEAVDPTTGNPITEINLGETFTLNVYVDDNRDPLVTSQGVSQAYLDVTYQDSLVSATGAVVPGDDYLEAVNPNSLALPGLIDEGGGTQTDFGVGIGPLGPDPVLLYSIIMQATAAGTVTFTGDPADISPQHDVTLFGDGVTGPITVNPTDVSYGFTSLTVLPMNADDDAFSVSENSSNNILNVLQNDDLVDPATSLTITNVGATDNGGAVVNNGDHLVYTPAADFVGTETFTYTVEDDLGNSDTATVTVTVSGSLVQFRLETTDLGGSVTSTVNQGDSFVLNVYVEDLRPDTIADRGVFQAFVDVTYDDALVTALGSVTHGTDYESVISGSLTTAGLVDEAGGADTDFGLSGPLGAGEFLLFSVTFDAANPGTVVFVSDPADNTVYHSVLLFEPPGTVPNDSIVFTSTTLTISPGPLAAFPDAYSVDEDSTNNVLDVLQNDETYPPGGTLTITNVGPTDNGGTVVNNGTQLVYTPTANFAGTETFTYTVTDGLGNSDQTTVTVAVNEINDEPVANDDGGAGYETFADVAYTTSNVLANDLDADGDALSITAVDTTGTLGLVTDNGDGTFGYDPNGQFDYLLPGQDATDTFAYTVSDGRGGEDSAIVMITVKGTLPPANHVTGFVYADVDNDGVKDSMERAIGGVEVRLEGMDVTGSAVSLISVTDALGRYDFSDVLPGNYTLTEVQPNFYVDGFDTINGVIHTGRNDTITITPAANLANFRADFGERSLEPDFITIDDYVNPLPRQGIVIGVDSTGTQLWYSLLDGWEDVTDVNVTFSSNGTMAIVTIWRDTLGPATFSVPALPSNEQFRVKGTTDEGRVVQIVGTLDSYLSSATSSLQAPKTLNADADTDSVDAVFLELAVGGSATI